MPPRTDEREIIGRSQAVRSIWEDIPGDFTIVPAAYLSDDGREPSTGWGELKAMAYMLSVLYAFYPPRRVDIVVPSPPGFKADFDRLAPNIIVIGGPVHNKLAEELLSPTSDLNIPFCFEDFSLAVPEGYGPDRSYSSHLKDTQDPWSYDSDSGCIVYREREMADRLRRIWLFMGCHTYGTYASVVAAFSERFCQALEQYDRKGDYEFVVRIDNLEAFMNDRGEVRIYVESAGQMPRIGPINNRIDTDIVLEEVAFGLRYEQEKSRKRFAYLLLGLALWVLVWPSLLIFIVSLFR